MQNDGSTSSDIVHFAKNFDDPCVAPDRWEAALLRSKTRTVNQTYPWLRAWWETMGRGELVLAAVERSGSTRVIVPCYIDQGLVLFLGAGESDYLDIIGDPDPALLKTVFSAIRERFPCMVGFRFHLVPGTSDTPDLLRVIADPLGMELHPHGEPLPAFEVDMVAHRHLLDAATKRSMLKREAYFRRHGALQVTQFRTASDAAEHLPDFFVQHHSRWLDTGYDSPFLQPNRQRWLARLCDLTADAGWLRGTRLDWDGRLLGISFAWYYNKTHFCGPWSFAKEHAKHCPGHVLLRYNITTALSEQLERYDLRGGDDHYKSRFPTVVKCTRDWGLYYP